MIPAKDWYCCTEYWKDGEPTNVPTGGGVKHNQRGLHLPRLCHRLDDKHQLCNNSHTMQCVNMFCAVI